MPFTLSNMFGSRAVDAPAAAQQTKPEEIELTDISSKPSAPTASVAEAVQQHAQSNFEWNVGRLFSKESGKSEARTWAVRILSTFLVLPLVLTLIVDIGRRLAYSAGFVNGKSFSLFDKVSQGCKAAASKAASIYKSFAKPSTKEELNAQSEKTMKALAEKLVGGFKALNGGYFTDSSFSSPPALKGERQIKDAKDDLVRAVHTYVSRNAKGTDDFIEYLNKARSMVQTGISEAAGNDPYISDKVKRAGPPQLIRNWAGWELQAELDSDQPIKNEFIELAMQEPDFSAGLKKGIEAEVLGEGLAKSVFKDVVEESYTDGLQTGLDEANERLEKLFDAGVKSELITKEEAVSIEESIQPGVSVLAKAAAKDVVRDQTSETTDDEITVQLTEAADALKERKKLKPEDETQFLTAARDQLAKVKEDVAAQALKQKQAAEVLKQKEAAEAQKAADQSSLLGKFLGMLGLIEQKQTELRAQFLKFDELEKQRQAVTDSLQTVQTTKVAVRGVPMTVLDAGAEFYRAATAISNSNSKPAAKNQQMKDLIAKGFSQNTMELINKLRALEPRLAEVIEEQAVLAEVIEKNHEEVTLLRGKFNVYKGNNSSQLEITNRKAVEDKEKEVSAAQKTLDQRYRQLAETGASLTERLRTSPLSVVSMDPKTNKEEVEALVDAFKKAQNSPPAAVFVPQPDSPLSGVGSVISSPFKFLWSCFPSMPWARASAAPAA